jgi:hypothetical protein
MSSQHSGFDFQTLGPIVRSKVSRIVAAGRNRRKGLMVVLMLSVPMAAWAQPLGLLLWARLRLLTKQPRTAMANPEEISNVIVEIPERFPDLKDIGFDESASRDPFRFNPKYFPTLTQSSDPQRFERKSPGQIVDPTGARNRYLTGIVRKFRVQALIAGKSIAIIDDRTYRVGDLLDFERTDGEYITLRSVGRNSVVVEVDGQEFEIRLVGRGTDEAILR